MNIAELVEAQRHYFQSGKTLNYADRIKYLNQLSSKVRQSEKAILDAFIEDLNKSELEAFMTEIAMFQHELDYARKHLKKWMRNVSVPSPLLLFPARCYKVPEPYGVTLIMSPWNYPWLLSMQPLVGAIAAGNCVILKTSAYAPHISTVIRQIIESVFPKELCCVVEGSRKENAELLQQKFDYIFFTGSVNVGKTVMEAASHNLTPVTLELGGKSPVIIDETANLEVTASRLVFGKYMNAGQTCVAPDYVFVHESKKDELIKLLRKYIEKYYAKDGNGHIADYPKIINEKHFERVCGLMRDANIVIGGGKDATTRTIEPTVLDHVTPESPVMQEEIFGPILPIMTYSDLNAVIEFINARPRPLALYHFSTDSQKIQYVQKRVPFGGGCLNDTLLHVTSVYLPFGGIGESGMGSYHGKGTFDTFTHYKGIVDRTHKIDFSARFRPYTDKKKKFMRKLL